MSGIAAATIHPIQRQLDACNARDMDAFMRWWAKDRLHYAFPDALPAIGVEAIRERRVERFREPDTHGTLLHGLIGGSRSARRVATIEPPPSAPRPRRPADR